MAVEFFRLRDLPEPMCQNYDRLDWVYWQNMPQVGLPDMVCLSLDIEPRSTGPWHNREHDPNAKRPLALLGYFSRLKITQENARHQLLPSKGSHNDNRTVRFSDFRIWAGSLSPAWELPAAFPQGANTPVAETSKKVITTSEPTAITIEAVEERPLTTRERETSTGSSER